MSLYDGGIQSGGWKRSFLAVGFWFLTLVSTAVLTGYAAACVVLCAYVMLLPPLYVLKCLSESGCLNEREVLESDFDPSVTMAFPDSGRNMRADIWLDARLAESLVFMDFLSLLTFLAAAAARWAHL